MKIESGYAGMITLIAFLSSAIMAIFWNIYNLILGSIPSACSWGVGLCISRSWDVFTAPAIVIIWGLLWVITKKMETALPKGTKRVGDLDMQVVFAIFALTSGISILLGVGLGRTGNSTDIPGFLWSLIWTAFFALGTLGVMAIWSFVAVLIHRPETQSSPSTNNVATHVN